MHVLQIIAQMLKLKMAAVYIIMLTYVMIMHVIITISMVMVMLIWKECVIIMCYMNGILDILVLI